MIDVEKEPKELYEEFRVHEKCIFCNDSTEYWNEEENEPICKKCAAKYNNEHIKMAKELSRINAKKKQKKTDNF
jgi:uncharacterized Zn ribbon protein